MAEKAKSLVEAMKNRIANAGSGSKGNIFYVKKDGKVRVRFLNDMEDGLSVMFHDKWQSYTHPCMEYYGKPCPHHNDPEGRNQDFYAWTVWNYETKKREIFLYKANRCSPIPSLISMFETYGTLCDRDFVITRQGQGTDTTYSVIPMDKKRSKIDEEPFSKKEVFKMLLQAFPCEEDGDVDDEDYDVDEDEDEEEETPKKSKSKTKSKPKSKSKYEEEDDEDEDEDDEDYDEDEEEEDEEPVRKKSKKSPPKKSKSKKSSKYDDDEDEEDDEEDEDLPFDDDEEDEEEEERPRKKSSRTRKKR